MEKLLKGVKSRSKAGIIIVFLIGIVFVGVGVYSMRPKEQDVEDIKAFDKDSYSSDLSAIEAYYLIGPVASDSQEGIDCYIAVGEEEIYAIVTGKTNETGLPVITENTTDEEIENFELVKTAGKPVKIDNKLATILANTYNELEGEEVLDLTNYNLVYGKYYLDTKVKSEGDGYTYLYFILAAIFLISGIIMISGNNKQNKKIKEKIEELRQSGELEKYNADIEAFGEDKYNKQLKTLLTDNYLYSINDNVTIVPIKEIINAYSCCIIDNKITNFDYIAIETKGDKTYYVAQKAKDAKNKNFDNLLLQIKEKIN